MLEISIEGFVKKGKKKSKDQRNRYKFMLEDQKEKLKQYQRDYYSSQKTIKWNNNFFLHNIKICAKVWRCWR